MSLLDRIAASPDLQAQLFLSCELHVLGVEERQKVLEEVVPEPDQASAVPLAEFGRGSGYWVAYCEEGQPPEEAPIVFFPHGGSPACLASSWAEALQIALAHSDWEELFVDLCRGKPREDADFERDDHAFWLWLRACLEVLSGEEEDEREAGALRAQIADCRRIRRALGLQDLIDPVRRMAEAISRGPLPTGSERPEVTVPARPSLGVRLGRLAVALAFHVQAPGSGHYFARRPLYGGLAYLLFWLALWPVAHGVAGSFALLVAVWIVTGIPAWIGAWRRPALGFWPSWMGALAPAMVFLAYQGLGALPIPGAPSTTSLSGRSFSPSLVSGDRLVWTNSDTPRRGEIVIYERANGKRRVVRVVGLPGERVELRTKQVLIDGVVLEEPYARWEEDDTVQEPLSLASEEFYCLGDWRAIAEDSRTEGPIRSNQILGRVRVVLWSSSLKSFVRFERFGKRVESPFPE